MVINSPTFGLQTLCYMPGVLCICGLGSVLHSIITNKKELPGQDMSCPYNLKSQPGSCSYRGQDISCPYIYGLICFICKIYTFICGKNWGWVDYMYKYIYPCINFIKSKGIEPTILNNRCTTIAGIILPVFSR